ncbi:MAG: ABC transporter permease, partial [Lachnospiraceae bacterium]|nr:ABC transporter permease [Lachnospiraceae bacterium]
CIQVDFRQIVPLCVLVILSAYIASLIGLFVGHFSLGLMVGIVYIKIVMILFLAPPILFYLLIPTDSMVYLLSYLFPSSAAFYGLMDLLGGQTDRLWLNFVVLAIHAIVLSCFYFFIAIRRNGNILSRLIIELLNNKTFSREKLTDV